jgi:hypothetical protein
VDKPIYLTQDFKIVSGSAPADSAWDITGDYVSLKNAHMGWIVVSLQFDAMQPYAHTVQPMKATAVAPVGATAITHDAPNWANNDISVSDTLVRGADATSYQVPATVANKLVIFQIDPMQLGDTFDCMGCFIDGNAKWQSNLATIMYFVEMRYGQATPPSIIVD